LILYVEELVEMIQQQRKKIAEQAATIAMLAVNNARKRGSGNED
jgi:hypothetical protein